MGDNILVPSTLVFGIVSRFPVLNTNLPNQRETMEIIKIAQAAMISTIK